MFEVLKAAEIGMSLTESLAMTPAASVSGFHLAHPDIWLLKPYAWHNASHGFTTCLPLQAAAQGRVD